MKRFQFTPDIDEVIYDFYPQGGSQAVQKILKEQSGIEIKKNQVVGRAQTLNIRFVGDVRGLNNRQVEAHKVAIEERDAWHKLISLMPVTKGE